nr:RNA-directed DNA polymerase, eukaryota [Tanacetum cinerariifolium]
MFFKVDFAKAYDSVRWDFLLDVLQAIGFGPNWCKWIRGVKVGESTSRHKAWSDLIQKLRSRLSKWKVKTLSIGGRLTLLKSVHGASLIYNMSIYKVWRFVSQDGSLWYWVIQAIHEPSIESHASQVSSNWCSKLRELEVLKSKGFNFLSYYFKRIRDGCQTHFWQDHWLAGMVLRDSFPRIFSLELDKDVLVTSKMREDMAGSFRRNVRDGVERQQFSELVSMLESVSLSSAQDRWCCDLSGDGEFQVKDIRNQVDDMFLPFHSASTRWVIYIPIKINVFAWRVYHDCFPTRLNLFQRGVSLDSLSCPLCQASVDLFTIPCFNVPWPSLCFVRFVDGGICLSKICRRFQIGLPGSQLFDSLVSLRRCWKVFSILRGGLFRCFVIVLSLMLRLQDDRLSLMILFPYPSFGVLVDVIGCSLGNIG